jgi:hypothetical protein
MFGFNIKRSSGYPFPILDQMDDLITVLVRILDSDWTSPVLFNIITVLDASHASWSEINSVFYFHDFSVFYFIIWFLVIFTKSFLSSTLVLWVCLSAANEEVLGGVRLESNQLTWQQICLVFEWSGYQMPGTKQNWPFEYQISPVLGSPL